MTTDYSCAYFQLLSHYPSHIYPRPFCTPSLLLYSIKSNSCSKASVFFSIERIMEAVLRRIMDFQNPWLRIKRNSTSYFLPEMHLGRQQSVGNNNALSFILCTSTFTIVSTYRASLTLLWNYRFKWDKLITIRHLCTWQGLLLISPQGPTMLFWELIYHSLGCRQLDHKTRMTWPKLKQCRGFPNTYKK